MAERIPTLFGIGKRKTRRQDFLQFEFITGNLHFSDHNNLKSAALNSGAKESTPELYACMSNTLQARTLSQHILRQALGHVHESAIDGEQALDDVPLLRSADTEPH